MGNNGGNIIILTDEAIIRAIEASGIETEDVERLARALRDALEMAAELIAKAFNDALDALNLMLNDLTETFREIDAKSRRDWPRPQNQRVRPLLLDRRRKVYHCRNVI